jgi:hypothetical protein
MWVVDPSRTLEPRNGGTANETETKQAAWKANGTVDRPSIEAQRIGYHTETLANPGSPGISRYQANNEPWNRGGGLHAAIH